MLADRMRMSGGASVAEVSFLSSVATASTNPFSESYSFGDAASNRYLIAVVTGRNEAGGDNEDIAFDTAVVIGGVTATQVVADVVGDGGDVGFSRIFIAAVPTGASGTVSVTVTNFSQGTFDAFRVSLYRATGLHSSAPTSTSTGNSSLNLTVPEGGFAVMGFGHDEAVTPGDITNATTDAKSTTGAHGHTATPGAATFTASGANLSSAAAWR